MANTANAYIVSPKISDAAILTASDAVGNAGASNLQKARPRLIWQSTSMTPYIVWDFGAAVPLDTLIMGYFNAKSGNTFRLRLASTVAKLTDGTAEQDNGIVTYWPSGADWSAYKKPHRSFQFTKIIIRYARIDFGWSSNSDGFVSGGRAFLGLRISPATSWKSGWVPGFDEPIAETIDMGGEESPRIMGAKRSLEGLWPDLVESERSSLYSTLLERGSAQDFALVVDDLNLINYQDQIAIGRCKRAYSFPQTILGTDPTTGGRVQHYSYAIAVNEMAPCEMV